MDRIRPPAVAGSFYPSDTGELNRLLDECFASSPLGPKGTRSSSPALLGGMVPHAGYIYSGPCAAHLYACLDSSMQLVILLGVTHRSGGAKAALSPWNAWRTPFGDVPVNQQASELLQTRVRFLKKDDLAHTYEHSIEVQMPFLQRVLGNFTFVPISLSRLALEECIELGAAIAELYEVETRANVRTIILASSDLNHYLSPGEIDKLDRLALEPILALDPSGLWEVVEAETLSMCGVLPTAVMLFAANAVGAKQARLLKHCHSGDVSPMSEVVGYASVAVDC
ncbi:MAG TPA: AmmeMemoRadiSam system protein B [Methylomirabilota bacterium]|nr:AmmeMemoRadiSam system protein B [Methylomirabilota bacterium]